MKKENIQVTPEKARKRLEQNFNCRTPSRSHVSHLAMLMSRAEWLDNHPDPIMFDHQGRLRNGQHRLLAIIESGVSVYMTVWFEVPEEILQNIDTARPRRLYEQIKLHENRRGARLVSSICYYANSIRNGHYHFAKPSIEQVAQILKDWGDEIEFLIPLALNSQALQRGAVVFAVMEYMKTNPKGAREFAQSLFLVDGPVQQARVLRDFLLQNRGTSSRTCFDQYKYTVMACGYHSKGRPVKQLKKHTWDTEVSDKE
jgi:hypothetical protein